MTNKLNKEQIKRFDEEIMDSDIISSTDTPIYTITYDGIKFIKQFIADEIARVRKDVIFTELELKVMALE